MDNRETQCSGPAVALAFLGGAVAGVVAGLLLAPKSGGGDAPGFEGVCQEGRGRSPGEGKGSASRPRSGYRAGGAFLSSENGGCRGGGQGRTRDHEGKNRYML